MNMDMDNIIYKVERDLDTLEYIVTAARGNDRTITRYVETLGPDKKLLKEMLEHARGDHRTMAQFADNCSDPEVCIMNVKKINPPTFSRIMQENDVKRPMKAELMQALLNNAADRDFVSPDNLMKANGLVRKGEEGEGDIVTPAPFYGYSRAKNERAERDICRALISNNYQVLDSYPVSDDKSFTYAGKNAPLDDNTENRFDLEMDFNKVLIVKDPKGKQFKWGLVIDGTEPEDITRGECVYVSCWTEKSDYVEGYGFISEDECEDTVEDNVVENNGKILLRALIDPGSVKDMNISFVCQNRVWYNLAVEALKNVTVNRYISVVLIQNEEVVSEYTLKDKKGKNPKCLLGEFRERDVENRYDTGWIMSDEDSRSVLVPPSGY